MEVITDVGSWDPGRRTEGRLSGKVDSSRSDRREGPGESPSEEVLINVDSGALSLNAGIGFC